MGKNQKGKKFNDLVNYELKNCNGVIVYTASGKHLSGNCFFSFGKLLGGWGKRGKNGEGRLQMVKMPNRNPTEVKYNLLWPNCHANNF